MVHDLIEARDAKRVLRFQKQLAKYRLPIIDELGFVPLSKTGAELLFEVFSQRYERGRLEIFTDYRIRAMPLVRDYAMFDRDQARQKLTDV